MHSIAEKMWDEWGAYHVDDAREAEDECTGILAGILSARGDPVLLSTARLWPARRLLRLWRRTRWFDRWNIADSLTIPTDKKGRVKIRIDPIFRTELEDAARELSVSSLSSRHWAWLRGMWGSCGGLYIPQAGYYLVMRVSATAIAEPMRLIVSRTRIAWKERFFRGALEVLLKDQDSIVTFLCNLGLTDVALNLEATAAMRSVIDQANRASNCDNANISRILRAASDQRKLAASIDKHGLTRKLPPQMQELVRARLDNPEVSLSDIGEKLNPPVTKSTVKYRWMKLKEIIRREMPGIISELEFT